MKNFELQVKRFNRRKQKKKKQWTIKTFEITNAPRHPIEILPRSIHFFERITDPTVIVPAKNFIRRRNIRSIVYTVFPSFDKARRVFQ